MEDVSKRQHPDCPFIPLGDRVILKMDEPERYAGMIVIPDSAVDAPQYAIVLGLGDLVTEDIEVGDKISFGKYSGNILQHRGQEYLVIRTEDLLAKAKRD